MAELRAFTSEGITQVRKMLISRTGDPRTLLTVDRYTVNIADLDVVPHPFKDRQEAGEHLVNLLRDVTPPPGMTLDSDPGLWTWLAVLWFDELAPFDKKTGARRIGKTYRLVLEPHSHRTYYRHLLNGPYRIVKAFNQQIDLARVVLAQKVHTPGELVEQLASHQRIVTSPSLLGLATELYIDPETDAPKSGAGGKNRPGVVRRLVDVLGQLDATYDTWSMGVDDLLALLPAEFNRFRSDRQTGLTTEIPSRPVIPTRPSPTVEDDTDDREPTPPTEVDLEDVDFSESGEDSPFVSPAIDPYYSALDERQLSILALRTLVPENVRAATLDEIGHRFGVSRERVRQIETDMTQQGIPASLLSETGRHLLATLESSFSTITKVEALYRNVSELREPWLNPSGNWRELSSELPAHGTDTVLALIVAAVPNLHWDGRWVWRGDLEVLKTRTSSLVEEATENRGVGPDHIVETHLSSILHIPNLQTVRDWLIETGADHVAGRWFASRLRSVQDRAFALLQTLDEPVSGGELHLKSAPDREPRTFRNALSADDRFTRVSKDLWALTDWRLPAYTNIRDAMEQVLRDSIHDSLPVDMLVSEVLALHPDVSGTSVRMYAEWPPFQRDGETVQFWDGTLPPAWTDLTLTPEVHIEADDLVLDLSVNSEHLRGSGSAIPPQVAISLNVLPGQSVTPDSGAPMISWRGAQPTMGSIRQLLEQQHLTEGDRVLLVWHHRDPNQFEIVQA